MFTKYGYFDPEIQRAVEKKIYKSNSFKLITYFLKKRKKLKLNNVLVKVLNKLTARNLKH